MMSISATGFLAEKPELQMVGVNSVKCEFTVLWDRRERRGDQWETIWERAVFFAWGEEAERVASRLDKGSCVTCTGTQETSSWLHRESGQKRYATKYRLTAWVRHMLREAAAGDGQSAETRGARAAATGNIQRAAVAQGQTARQAAFPRVSESDEPAAHSGNAGEGQRQPMLSSRPAPAPAEDDFITVLG